MSVPVNINIGPAKKATLDAGTEMKKIAFATPDLTVQEVRNVSEVINSRWIANGPTVRKFESKIAERSKCDRAVCFDSCTGAMEMTLRALGIGPGDEVITTPYTYSATAEVIRNVGATIVFVDLDGKSFEMNYEKVAAAITEGTKAVMPVDIGGKLCNYESLVAAVISKQEIYKPSNDLQKAIGRVAIVADAAHSFGATQSGKVCGEFADFTCFSFHVLKNITTGGEGGAVVWKNIEGYDNDALESTFRLLGDHGQTSRDKSKGWEYDIALFGYNSIMTDVDAAMGIAQLSRLDGINKKRKHITKMLDKLFADSGIEPLIQHFGDDYQSAMHLYPIRLPKALKGEKGRNKVYFYLRDKGVPCNVHYKPLPMMTAYKSIGFDIKDFPNAYDMFKSLLTIPYHSDLTDEQIVYIVDAIKEAVESV